MISFKSLLHYFDTAFTFSIGGGDPQPTTNTTNTSNIPEYARPYVESMLGSAQSQIFNFNDKGNVSGFKGYTPYSTNMDDYRAGFSPMQKQAFQGAQNLQLPGQYGQATQLAGASGLGSLYTAGQAGQAGNQYNQMATNPNATQAFMNPYIQNSLSPQLDEMRRQYGVTGQQQQGAATQAGAFGGSREALMASENNRNMGTAMNQAIGSGYDKAFQAAQQAQQFGANLGLQGQQAALQGYGQVGQAAGTLGSIGQQQLTGQQGIIGLQNQLGGQQQAAEQAKIDQSIQNYATAQQYPMMQLGNMSNLIHGLPMEASTTKTYQAQPSGLSQLGGLGLGAYGVSQMGKGAAKGGVMKSYAGGGITSLENRQRIAENYNPQMLQQSVQNGVIPQSLGTALSQDYSNQQQAVQAMPQSQGVTALPSNLPVEGMAQGGIIAFDDGGKVERFASKGAVKARNPSGWDYEPVAPDYTQADAMIEAAKAAPLDLEGVATQRTTEEGKRGIADIYTPMMAKLKEKQAGLEGKRNDARASALANAGFAMMAGTSPNALQNIGQGARVGMSEYNASKKDINALEENYSQQDNTIAMAQNAYKEAALSNDTSRMDKAKATILAAQQNKQAMTEKYHGLIDTGMLEGAKANASYNEKMAVERVKAAAEKTKGNPEANLREKIYNRATQQFSAIYGPNASANLMIDKNGGPTPAFKQVLAEAEKYVLYNDPEATPTANPAASVNPATPSVQSANAKLTMDGFAFPDQKSLNAYMAAKNAG